VADTTVGTLVANLRLDNTQFNAGLGGAEKAATGFGSRISRIGDIMTGVFGANVLDAAARHVVNFFQGAFSEAQEAIKVTAETSRVIESMGGVANVTAKHVANLSEAISNKVGVDDEAIQSGANLLLTFGNIRNEVGKGNKVFDQATRLAVDMSSVFKQDLKSSAIQLGKALNDPISGLTSLRRVGIQFTDQQEQQIKTMVEANDVLGAQKVILAEVSRQVGGAAAAAATPFEKLQVRFKNLQEEIGMKMMPVLVRLADWFNREGLPAIERFIKWVEVNWPQISKAFQDTWAVVGPILKNLMERIEATAKTVEAAVDLVSAVIHGEWGEAWEAAQRLVRHFVDWLWETFLELPSKLFVVFVELTMNVLNALPGLMLDLGVRAMHALWNGIKYVGGQIIDWYRELPGRIVFTAGAVVGMLLTLGSNAMNALWDGVRYVGGQIVDWFAGLPGRILDALQGIAERLYEKGKNAGRSLLEGLKDGASGIGNALIPDLSPGFDVPGIPGFASGGVIPGPAGAARLVVGHGGEAVFNQDQLRALGSAGVGGGGGTVVNVTVYGWVGNDQDIAKRLTSVFGRAGGPQFPPRAVA
jgi:hypothetical protein